MITTHTNAVAKIASVVAGLALVASSFVVSAPAARAATIDELQAQITALLAQISALQGGATTSVTFTRDLTLGSSGTDVTALQNWLIKKGYSIPAGATGYFGAQTQAALAAYQAAQGIVPAAGYFGPVTRAKVNAAAPTTPTTPTAPSDDELNGGAGSVDSYELISGLRNEEVGEDEEDVEIAGLEIEVDSSSDIRLTALRLVFDEGTAGNDFEDYADEVSVYLDGDEIARVDADDFNDDNDWSKTITLSRDAIIDRGETGDLTVAISGASNIDSADIGGTWTVDFRQLRFVDADGASISEDPDTDSVQFSFESFATAANTGLKISENDEDINDSRVINVDDSNRTRNVEILSFLMEVEGDSDLVIDSLPVEFTVTGAAHLDEMVSAVYLYVDGDRVASENVPTDEETVVFDNIDLELEAGEEYEAEIRVDFLRLDGFFDEGDTIAATISETETDSADFDVEDESGEELTDADITGSATSGPHAVYDSGIMLEFVSSKQELTRSGDNSGLGDRGSYTIVFDVTAFDADARIDRSCEEDDAVDAAGQGIEYTITNDGNNTTICNLSASSSDTEDTANTFEVDENKTRRFTFNVVATATGSGFAQVRMNSLNWGTATDDTNANYYTFNLNEFRTGVLYMNIVP